MCLLKCIRDPVFENPSVPNTLNMSQKRLKPAEKHFYPTFSLFWAKFSQAKSDSVRSEILGLFVNTFTGDNEYSRHNREILPIPTQMQLSRKLRIFCDFFGSYLEYLLEFYFFGSYMEYLTFWKENNPHSWRICKIIDSERCGYLKLSEILFLKTLLYWTC